MNERQWTWVDRWKKYRERDPNVDPAAFVAAQAAEDAAWRALTHDERGEATDVRVWRGYPGEGGGA